MAPRAELVRFVAGPDGPMPGAGAVGRGAWLCADEDCAQLAIRRGTLARALRIDRAAVERSTHEVRRVASARDHLV